MTMIDKTEVLAILAPAPNSKGGLWAKRKKALYDAIAALPARGVGVKPLVWRWSDQIKGWRADCELTRDVFVCYESAGKWCAASQVFSTSWHPSPDAGKDHLDQLRSARILAALEPTTTADPGDDVSPSASDPVTTPPTGAAAAAVAPTDAAHVNETPKSEHDAGNVLTDAQAREAAKLVEALRLSADALDWARCHLKRHGFTSINVDTALTEIRAVITEACK